MFQKYAFILFTSSLLLTACSSATRQLSWTDFDKQNNPPAQRNGRKIKAV